MNHCRYGNYMIGYPEIIYTLYLEYIWLKSLTQGIKQRLFSSNVGNTHTIHICIDASYLTDTNIQIANQ